jgi:hypothetical protein
MSPIATVYACTPPTGLMAPHFVETTATKMTLKWHEPSDNGGCPLLGFSLFRDDGSGSIPSIEVNTDNDPLMRNIPTLTEADVQLNSADLGLKFTFILTAYNREGSTQSAPISYLFSTVPAQPSVGPQVLSFSSSSMRVKYLFTDSSGGSQILSYNLQMMPSYTGVWQDVIGADNSHSLATEHTIDLL